MTVHGVVTHAVSRFALARINGDPRAVHDAGRRLKWPPNCAYCEAARIANRVKELRPVEQNR